MIKNSSEAINEIDLDEQLEETQNIKQCILEFSTTLQKAQDRLLEEDASKKIKESLLSTQKINYSHSRRYNSYIPSLTSQESSKKHIQTELKINNIPVAQETNPKSSSNTDREYNYPKHYRNTSDFHEDPQKKFESLQLPITPSLVYRYFKYLLSPFEQGEVLEFNDIYFLGLKAHKNKNYSVSMNYGYDDDKGDYKIIIGDHIAYRYEIMQFLGKGSFGQVIKVFDHKEKKHFALKIIRNKPRFNQQAEVEIKVLKNLLEYDKNNKYHIVHIQEGINFRNHSCIVFEMLGCSLYDVLKTNGFKGINIRYIKRYAYQILQSLYLMSKLKLIHCDLKPENILLTESSNSSIKIIDFGSSCYKQHKTYTYIQSRFYRAPEVIFGLDYNEKIDIWSFGCILVELYIGCPLFPGESELDLFNCMIEVLNLPPGEILEQSSRKGIFFNSKGEPRIAINSKGKKRCPNMKSLNEILNGADLDFIDLVKGKNYIECLQWDPYKRITPRAALEHN